jgi:hypothetical protein
MTKRSLYAGLVLIMLVVCHTARAADRTPGQQPPCAACLVITMQPGQTLLLPERLHGLTILVEVAGDTPGDAVAAVDHIRDRGGRPGVLLTPVRAGTEERTTFETRMRLADVRGAVGTDVLVVLAALNGPWPSLWSYADAVVTGQPAWFAGKPVRAWPLIDAASAADALAQTSAGGAEHWVVTAPTDALDARAFIETLARAAAPPPDAFTEEVEVRGARRLTALEVVARHQAASRRQQLRVNRVISRGVMTLTFEAPGFPAPITITSDTVVYEGAGRTELEQRSIRVNGIEFKGTGVPRLPIIEPERVASLPLKISLSDVYRYRLLPEETIRGIPCYVVAFEPVNTQTTLFRGQAWIARETFAAVRISAMQTGLRGAIVSSEQIDDFAQTTTGAWLLSRSESRQLYEGAAHRTPIQRILEISHHEVNPPDFDARLQRAYASTSLMLRDTAEGFRYLRREPVRAGAGEAGQTVRVEVAEPADRIRTLAAGVIIDPNISHPLPFAGISYADFNLFDTGAQLNAFFGGSYGQLAFSMPSLGGTRWQLGARAFGIASSYNDRAFRQGREIYDENVRQRPAHVSVWILRPLSSRLAMRVGYDMDYTRLTRSPETAAGFITPANQVVHGARLAIEGQQGGWTGSAWWNPARRAGWRAWGRPPVTDDVTNGSSIGPPDYDPRHHAFQRFGFTLSRAAALTPGVITRVELAGMSGVDLDRFSRYSFGTFDNRLRGYPSALVRYDRGAVVRSALAWSFSRVARLDGFVDTAWVRDRGFGTGYRNYTGVGAALEAPAPFGVLTSVEWGYGFRGVNADGGIGTHVIRVSAFKVF